jgi:hypothetical protein
VEGAVATSRSDSVNASDRSPRRRTAGGLRPWKAPSLEHKRVVLKKLSYVVVDEIVDDTVGLSVSPWPGADDQGRLRFTVDKDPEHVGVEVHELCTFLTERRHLPFVPVSKTATEQKGRELRIGTSFAMEVTSSTSREWTDPLERYVGRVFDITADAREVAKLAYYGAMTEQWNHRHAMRNLQLDPRSSGAGGM